MIFAVISLIVLTVAGIVFCIVGNKKDDSSYLIVAFILMLIAIILLCGVYMKNKEKMVDVLVIAVARAFPEKFSPEEIAKVNDKIVKLSRWQGTIFSWYNDVDLSLIG